MKRITLIIALLGATSATAAFGQANEVFFRQTDRAGGAMVGIGVLTIQQSGSAGNRIGSSAIPSFLNGGAGSLRIRQLNASSATNITEIAIESRDTGANDYDFEFKIDGSGNSQKFTFGSLGVASSNTYTFVDMSATGDDNVMTVDLASATGTELDLSFMVIIDGDMNAFESNSQSGVGSVSAFNLIQGHSNKLTVSYGNNVGRRDSEIVVRGNNNDWTLNHQSTNAYVKVNQFDTGQSNLVTGVVNQINASDAYANLELRKFGTGAFALGISQVAANTRALVSLTALNGGSFTLNQASAGANYTATHTIAAGGTVTINQ